MNNVKFLTSISIGIFVYVLVSIFAGPDGIWAYNQLNYQKNILSTNVEKITKINDTLNLDYLALENDVGIITSKARSLGFIYEGEKLIKINGISDQGKSFYDTGSIISLEEITFLPEKSCKIICLMGFILSFIIFLLVDLKIKSKNKPVTVSNSVFTECRG